MEQKLRLLFLLTSLVYVVFSITSTVSHSWMQTIPVENSTAYKETKRGLFMQCVEGEEFCKDLPEDADKMPEWWFDVRALVIVSCLFSSFAAYVEILHQLFEKVQRYFTTIVMFIANLLLLIAVSMFTKKHDLPGYQYGWGYILSWVAFVFGIAVIVIGAVSSNPASGGFNIQMEEPATSKSESA